VLLGSTRGLTQDVNFYRDVHQKGLTVGCSRGRPRPSTDDIAGCFTLATDIRTSIDLLASGRVNAGPLISETVPYTRAPEAYAKLVDRTQPLTTVAIDWRGAEGDGGI
jgi:L-iditol 2-dehydrogenase